jgi:Domain of Unknown Function (DUF1080)
MSLEPLETDVKRHTVAEPSLYIESKATEGERMSGPHWARNLLCFALISLGLCEHSPAQDKPIFTPLFDGRSLDGWVPPEGPDAANFSVRNGVISIKGMSGWLHTKRMYQNFTLRASVRFLKTEQLGNSGIFMRSPETSSFAGRWPGKTFEIESRDMTDNKALSPPWMGQVLRLGGDGGRAPEGVGTYRAAAALAAFRSGDWNDFEVIAQGTKLWAFLNGVLVSTADNVADIPGHIGLQAETGETEWRNISINEHSNDPAAFHPLISPNMHEWTSVTNRPSISALHDDAVVLTNGVDVLRSTRTYGDFTVRFQYRADSNMAFADFVFRASEETDAKGRPKEGASVRLRTLNIDQRTGGPPALVGDPRWPGAISSLGAPLEFNTYDSRAAMDAKLAPDAWQDCQIVVAGDQATVAINGYTVAHATGIPLSRGGRLTLIPAQGNVAIRNISILDAMGETF